MTAHPLPAHVTAWLHDAARHLERIGHLGHPMTIAAMIGSGVPFPLAARRPRQAKAQINRLLHLAFARSADGDCLSLGAFAVSRAVHPPRAVTYTFHPVRLMLDSPVNNP